MESGNQKWNPIWADLQNEAIDKKNKNKCVELTEKNKKLYCLLFKIKLFIVFKSNENEPVIEKNTTIEEKIEISLILLNENAFKADFSATHLPS